MRPNLTQLISKTLVDQFENVTKEEIEKNVKHREKLAKKLEKLSESYEEILKKYDLIELFVNSSFHDVKKNFSDSIRHIEEDFDSQRRYIKDNTKKISDFIDKFHDFSSLFLTKEKFEKEKLLYFDYVKKNDLNIESIKKHCVEKIFETKCEYFAEVSKLENECKKKDSDLLMMLNKNTDTLNQYFAEKNELLKEFRSLKMQLFSIHKNIEYIHRKIKQFEENESSRQH